MVTGTTVNSQDKLFFPKSLYEDKHQNIWIGQGQTVVRFSKGQCKKYHFKEETNTGSIYGIYRGFSFVEDEGGHLWALAFSGELYYFDASEDAFVACKLDFPISNVGSFTKIKNNTFWIGGLNGSFEIELAYPVVRAWKQISTLKDISRAMLVADEFYVGTWSAGLFKTQPYHPKSFFTKVAALPFNDILGLTYNRHTGLWVAGSENVVSLASGFFKSVPLPVANVAVEVMGLLPDSMLVVGTLQDFYTLKKDRNTSSAQFNALSINLAPTALLCDTNRIWIGTLDGSVFYYEVLQKTLHRIKSIQASSTSIVKIAKDNVGNI